MPTYEVRLAGYVTVVAEDEDDAESEALRFFDTDNVDIESVTLIEDNASPDEKEGGAAEGEQQ